MYQHVSFREQVQMVCLFVILLHYYFACGRAKWQHPVWYAFTFDTLEMNHQTSRRQRTSEREPAAGVNIDIESEAHQFGKSK